MRILFRTVALFLAATHTAVAMLNQSMNEDGINYLDLGDAFLAGDWEAAINGIWSPVYGCLLAIVLRIAQPSMSWEFPTVQLVNFAVFCVALLSFEFFWRELDTHRQRRNADAFPFSPAVWTALGYSLFIWVSLNLIHVWSVTPDMGVAAVVYFSAGIALRSSARPDSLYLHALLGAVLGLGFLVKAALFPLGLALLVLTAFSWDLPAGKVAKRLGFSFAAFVLAASPLLLPLSLEAGRPSFGGVGRFTYLKHVNGMPYPDFRAAADALNGRPEHPPRLLHESPPVHEFGEPVHGSYPLAFDPGYWTLGVQPKLDAVAQLQAFLTNASFYFDLFVREQGAFLAVVALLLISSRWKLRNGSRLSPESVLLLWALAALAMYSIVHAIPRYVGPFVLVFWAAILGGLRAPRSALSPKIAPAAGTLLLVFVWLNIATFNLEGLGGLLGYTPKPGAVVTHGRFSGGGNRQQPEIATQLRGAGLEEGERVAFIGHSFSAYWARLARLRIVSEILPHHAEAFWNATPTEQAAVLDAFAKSGAVAVVSEPHETLASSMEWQKLGETGYLVHSLR